MQNKKSDPDPDPGLEPDPDHDPDPKSQLLCGLVTGVADRVVVVSIVNLPPLVLLSVELATVVVAEVVVAPS